MSRSEPRLFCPPDDNAFVAEAEVALSAEQAHYLANVLRLSSGQGVRLFNGRDGEWQAVLTTLRKNRAIAQLQACARPQKETEGPELLFAPLKRDATELMIRMGTEMGVSRFRPVITARTNTHRLNLERLGLIACEAAEQCERLDVPGVMPIEPLAAVLARWPERRSLAVALERHVHAPPLVEADALLIGPEGGFSPEEVARLEKLASLRPLSLGPLVLRADTAGCAALSRLNAAAALKGG
ncbi:16S rRNA (uracil(1498)-N(3))-methyltransferase [Oecophyllibacter saccharovorans]|uniref:Ribosomal RNA small subunit methyltransferase E n=1 Tax=Oecophyllibacter saccharovorans TaxID=2558360 RepID=A0A506UQU3_9PROT|nr:16S rRNA (uracil(1498)-N(3))-methyltransferase [Oecophyllibacter saccharovorans]TPW35710.1 16S rRNA (uracil(1498)-N(3))-methyltransferase [Oecophyllibacter saccharovorans]